MSRRSAWAGNWTTLEKGGLVERRRDAQDRRCFRIYLTDVALLALAVACLQLLLDRGEQSDWLEALEIQFYAIGVILALYLFVVHNLTGDHHFLSPRLLRDRNHVTGTLFIFVVGIVLLGTMALLPPYLQRWKGYPVVTTGMVLMPRGLGTMFTMMLAGRLMKYMDARLIAPAAI